MDLNNIAITARQLKIMKHCIGYNHGNQPKRHGKSSAPTLRSYRNHYMDYPSKDFDRLCRLGLMKKGENYQDCYMYFVTQFGYEFLETLLEIKIMRDM